MTVRQNIWILHQWDRKLCEKLIRIIKIFHRLSEDCHCVTFMIRNKIHQIFQRKNHQIFQQWDKIFQYFHNRTKLVKSVDYENISTCNIEQLTFDFEHLKEISERFYWKFNDQSSTINIRIQIFREVSTLEGLQTNWLLSWAVKFEAINLIMSSHFTWKKHSRLSSQHQKYSTEINCNLFVGIFIKNFTCTQDLATVVWVSWDTRPGAACHPLHDGCGGQDQPWDWQGPALPGQQVLSR